MRAWAPLLLLLGACQCGEDPRGGVFYPSDAGRNDAGLQDGSGADAGTSDGGDGGPGADGGDPDLDAGDGGITDGMPGDAGPTEDAGDHDAADSGAFDLGASDTGAPDFGTIDAGAPDSGTFDGGAADFGLPDSGGVDSGAFDAGRFDSGAGFPDAMVPDSGVGAGDLYIEIDYQSAFTPASPTWRYSNSPGWGPLDWDFTGGGSGAEAWDRFNNMSVVNDPIGGSVLEIGGSSELQLMFGLVPLLSYTTATVELEGRSRACCSSVDFDVYNPANGCGASGSMSQDWTADIVVLDLTGCFTPGSALQAVRVDPTNGAVALRRLRLTLSGAQW